MEKLDVKSLIAKYNNGTLSEEERAQLESWYISEVSSNKDYEGLEENLARLDQHFIHLINTEKTKQTRLWPRIAVAAAMAVMIFGAALFYYAGQRDHNEVVLIANDIPPGKNGATLTLANGRQILINGALAGDIASQSGVKISKNKDGQIIYEVLDNGSGLLEYNTLSTTRGEQTQVRLPDGSLVFLNSASSLRYPTSFAKQEKRAVVLTGEGYFEISSKYKVVSSKSGSGSAKVPFIVETIGVDGRPGQQVEVLGTHFNINAYADEKVVRTTLLEGSVRVWQLSAGATQPTTHNPQLKENPQLLSPGQQSVMDGKGMLIKQVEAEDVIAWKNGLFVFEDETLSSIMKRVERWYDVEVSYAAGVDKNVMYLGSVSRYDKVSKVLETIASTGGVHFKIEGRSILVMK